MKAATVTLVPIEDNAFAISIHAAREGGDVSVRFPCQMHPRFQSTPPVKAATTNASPNAGAPSFQSTPPVKAATTRIINLTKQQGFQSTPPVKAATFCNTDRVGACRISIHAAREGGDLWSMSPPRMPAEFQSTPPVKAATFMTTSFISSSEFQSTPPVKAATENIPQRFPVLRISIHAAREGGDIAQQLSEIEQRISIHAAREGGDIQRVNLGGLAGKFQSTPPVKAATLLPSASASVTMHFNPRRP